MMQTQNKRLYDVKDEQLYFLDANTTIEELENALDELLVLIQLKNTTYNYTPAI